ncbi:acyl-CoA dehydrogenase family protein [Amycolatopsis nigrescens]|uniref:acyl-CoA dehydrogenase family protein n=1 Tax=Amycolatopsis nigrescens TaxID=381445 RepID=UPI000381A997|nr:acyl-CoA dehydrogenase family protein [Amycolatopsis nigrescens]
MDFGLDETQREIAELTAAVLAKETDPGQSWRALADAGLLALALPAELGGDGLGVAEVAMVLTEVGRAAGSVPALPALAALGLGVLPLNRLGSPEQRAALLPGVAAGETLLTAAVHEPSNPFTTRPGTTAVTDGGVWRLSGTKIAVPHADTAARILVPASLPTGTGIFLVDPAADGVACTATHTSGGGTEHSVRLDGVVATEAELLTDSRPGEAIAVLHRYALAAAVALGDGALAGALELTTRHVASREQFGRPLAAFQAVAQQIADVYITSRTLHLAALSAVWRLSAGLDPGQDLEVAAYWLAEEAPKALASCHHLHGGLGVDVTYPLHRYYGLVKDLGRFTGGAADRLAALGERVAG